MGGARKDDMSVGEGPQGTRESFVVQSIAIPQLTLLSQILGVCFFVNKE